MNNKMKKIIILASSLCLMASAVSCGKDDEAAAPEAGEPAVSSSEARPETPTETLTEAPEEIPTETEEDNEENGEEDNEEDNGSTDPCLALPDGRYRHFDTFTFAMPEGFEPVPDTKANFRYPSDGEIIFEIGDGWLRCGCTPDSWHERSKRVVNSGEEFRETGVLSCGKNEAAYYISDENYDGMIHMTALVSVGSDSLCLYTKYTTGQDALVRSLIEQIIGSAEYVGNFVTPTENRVIENDVFSVDLEPKWMQNTLRRSEPENNSLRFVYTCAEREAQFFSGLEIETVDKAEYPDARSYYEHSLEAIEKQSHNRLTDSIEDSEMLGERSYKLCYRKENITNFPTILTEQYILEKNGSIISIIFSAADMGDGDILMDELRDLANSIVVK